MRVLITGGAGFVGCNLVAHMTCAGGWGIRVLDDESTGSREHLAPYPGVEFVRGDIRDGDCLRRALDGCDAVVHLAADPRVVDSIADPAHNFSVNVVGGFELLLRCREAGVGRFVNASTGGAILGEATPPVHEEMAAHPLSPYGAAKLAVEGYVSAFSGSYGTSGISLRFSNLYGPMSFHKGSVVAAFFRDLLEGRPLTVYGDGSQRRDFLYVGDLVGGIERALRSPATGVFQLGSGSPTSLDELIEAIREIAEPQRRVEVRYEAPRRGEVGSTWCDISRARQALGFSPETSLREGLRQTWDWFLSGRSGETA